MSLQCIYFNELPPIKDLYTINNSAAAIINQIIPPLAKKLPSGIPLAFKVSPAETASGYKSATTLNKTTISTKIIMYFSIEPEFKAAVFDFIIDITQYKYLNLC